MAVPERELAGETDGAGPGLASEPGGHGAEIGNVEYDIEGQTPGRGLLGSGFSTGLSNGERNQCRVVKDRLKFLQP
jgi:hypothetical protein